jgi:hypothetical protein
MDSKGSDWTAVSGLIRRMLIKLGFMTTDGCRHQIAGALPNLQPMFGLAMHVQLSCTAFHWPGSKCMRRLLIAVMAMIILKALLLHYLDIVLGLDKRQ